MSDHINPTNLPAPTNPPTSLETVAQRLLPAQHQALTALITGQSLKAAAKAAGVHRSTIHRWMTRDALFRAAFNAYQHEAKESTKVKLLAAAGDAVQVVVDAVQQGDQNLAYKLLKDLGLLSKIQPGLTDPDLLLTQIQIDHAKRQSALHAEAQSLGLPLTPRQNPDANPAPDPTLPT